jgi:two-component system OmpR family response regulator
VLSRILLVDDEESLSDLVSSALRFAGYEVAAEYGGLGALNAVRSSGPDLVVLDVNLPDLSGFEVCRRMRADGIDTPVIFLTARREPGDLRTGFSHGGDDYLTKPFSLEELVLRIEAVLRRAQGGGNGPHRLQCGELVLDEDAHQVFVAHTEVELSPTEFRLLHYLLLNSGRVLSRMQILDYVWDYDFEGDAAITERYISYLRRKLGDHGSLIRTVRGVGYVLRAPGP